MEMQEKNFNNSILCNHLVELKGKFNYDIIRNVYYQKPRINFGDQPKWLHYERIELEFTKEFNEGFYREFYESGNLRREVPFISAVDSDNYFANGIEKVFYEDSDNNGNETYTLLEEKEYKCGDRAGIWKTYSIDGGLLKEDYFDDIIDLNNGFYGMKQIDYFPSSNKVASITDKEFGKSFYENGSIRAEWKNKNYIKDGDYTEFHENGSLKMKITHVNGEREGMMYKYYEDGSLKEEWKYSNGIRIYIKKYYQTGILKSEWLYSNGELTGKNEFDKSGNLKTKK